MLWPVNESRKRSMGWLSRGVCVVCCIACAGCGQSTEELERKRELIAIVFAYEDAWRYNEAVDSEASKKLQRGDYMVIWDVEILLPAERNAGKVLAYHRDVPEKGGMVGYQDGKVSPISRDEFERTPKAQPAANPKK
jgi:hypothetical protein